MTALSGYVGIRTDRSTESACLKALETQRIYGSMEPSVRRLGVATFGVCQFETLPEDRFTRQPCQIDDLLLAADIRIDNREELSAALGLGANDIRQMSDADMLGLAWRRWGSTCLERVIGDFALAVFSEKDRSLTLARDISGERPLFYAESGDAVVFASMPSGLLADPGLRRGFDLDRLAFMLAEIPGADDGTCYRGIRKVLPGHAVTFRNGQCSDRLIWTPSFEELKLASAEAYAEAYRAVLDTAVKCRLRRSSGPLAAHLSAGFDSSAVAATAARLLGRGEPVLAYTSAPRSGFEGPLPKGCIADESEVAALTAAMHGMEHVIVRSSGRALATVAAQAATYQDPFRNVLNLDWDTEIRQAARQRGALVLLGGELGNLTLNAGGLHVLGDFVARGEWRRWWHEARAAAGQPGVRGRSILYNSFRPVLPEFLDRWLQHRSLLNDPWQDSFLADTWQERVRARVPAGGRRTTVNDSYHRRFGAMLAFDPGTVRKGGIADSGVETRDPLVDRRVMEFSLSLPRNQLFANGVGWPLARTALSDRLPAEVLEQRLRGYQSADWHERLSPAQAAAMVRDISASETARELIDFDRLNRAIAQWPSQGLAQTQIVGRYVGLIPMTLAAGYFFLHLERSMPGFSAALRPPR